MGEAVSGGFPAPERLSKRGRQVWETMIAAHGTGASRIVGPGLEIYCEAVAVAAEAYERVAEEGMIIADPRGAPMNHPALAIAAAQAKIIEKLEPRFQPRVSRRRDGYMVAATRASVKAAGLDAKPEYKGLIATALTLALVIDNAQEEGRDALRRAAFGPIPTYVKTMKDLGLAPSITVESALAASEDSSELPVSDLDAWRLSREG